MSKEVSTPHVSRFRRFHPLATAVWLVLVAILCCYTHRAFASADFKEFLLPPATGVQANTGFGRVLARSDDYIVAGLPLEDAGQTDGGFVKVLDAHTGAKLFELRNPWSDVYGFDHFGTCVAISGSIVVVGQEGVNYGEVYVYDLSGASPTTPVYRLDDPSPSLADGYAHSVAISGSRILVGAYKAKVSNLAVGRAYLFDLQSSTPSVPVSTLDIPGAKAGDGFGNLVAIDERWAVVCAPKAGLGRFPIHVFDLQSATPSTAKFKFSNPGTQVAIALAGGKLAIGNSGSAFAYDLAVSGTPVAVSLILPGRSNSYFGVAVAVTGSRVVVSQQALPDVLTPGGVVGGDPGLIYVYTLNGSSSLNPTFWFRRSFDILNDNFGFALAVSGSSLVVGAPNANVIGTSAGALYQFDLSAASPTPSAPITSASPATGDGFGTAITTSGDWLVVGTPFEKTGASSAGVVYVYDRSSADPDTPILKLLNPGTATDDRFGGAVAIDGHRLVVGASLTDAGATDSGKAYVYDLDGANPTTPIYTLAHPSPAVNAYFGQTAAIRGSTVVIGAPGTAINTPGGAVPGSVFVFDLSSPTPTSSIATLADPTPIALDQFGAALALEGSRLVIGASQDSFSASAGHVFVYDLTGATPNTPAVILSNPTGASTDGFGKSVAISGGKLVVGAPYNDADGTNTGRLYLYDLNAQDPLAPPLIMPNPTPASDAGLGLSLGFSGNLVAAGFTANNSRCAFVYDLSSAAPTRAVTSISKNGAAGSAIPFAFQGAKIIVGFGSDDYEAVNKGSVGFFEIITPAPLFAASPIRTGGNTATSIVFGTQDSETSSAAVPVFCSNHGDAQLTIAATLTGVDASAFELDTTDFVSALAGSYEPDFVSTQLGVKFHPAGGGSYSATLHLASNDPKQPIVDITLTGIGNAAPTLTLPESPVIVEATSAAGAVADFEVGANDVEDGVLMPMISALSGSSFPMGDTTVTVSAKDSRGLTVNGSFIVRVRDTTAPAIDGTFTPLIFTAGTPLPDYRAYVTASDAVTPSFIPSQSPPPDSPTVAGPLEVTLTVTDAAGNSASKQIQIDVRPAMAPSEAVLSLDGALPDAGTPAGPPSDAKIVSFGQPAIDDAGHVVFVARWTSRSEGAGRGLFSLEHCLAKAGDAFPDGTSATYRDFADPVIDGGRYACVVALAHAPVTQAQAIIAGDLGGSPAMIARTGVANAFASGATFRSFNTVAVADGSVGFLARLTPRTGSPRVNATNDLGLWIKEDNAAPALVLRTGQSINGQTVKTLTSFLPGSGSAGQGRGWLRSGATGPQMLALAMLMPSRQQAIVEATTSGVTVLNDKAPGVVNANFASFGLPAANSGDTLVFAGSLKTGATNGGVTAGEARGIFADFGGAACEPIARTGHPAAATGGHFTVLRDPVLSDDDGLAFTATIQGQKIRGLATKTLWWKPSDGSLLLIARGGEQPRDMPAQAQFADFTSVAIATNRGPIFTASLVPGRGGVPASGGSGVWATDYTGHPRRLFGTTDPLLGSTVRAFSVLRATAGSSGVSRSFNATQKVVWLATLANRKTAIVVTEVP